jgi:alkylation response protein AidB-like acyl-CoA dehydrogenase
MSTQPAETETRSSIPKVQELGPTISSELVQLERERRLPAALARAMAQTGIFRLAIPKRHGGDEADEASIVRTIEELSVIDGSVGWCAMISILYGVFGGCLEAQPAHEIYGAAKLLRRTVVTD